MDDLEKQIHYELEAFFQENSYKTEQVYSAVRHVITPFLEEIAASLLSVRRCDECFNFARLNTPFCTTHAMKLGGMLAPYFKPQHA